MVINDDVGRGRECETADHQTEAVVVVRRGGCEAAGRARLLVCGGGCGDVRVVRLDRDLRLS